MVHYLADCLECQMFVEASKSIQTRLPWIGMARQESNSHFSDLSAYMSRYVVMECKKTLLYTYTYKQTMKMDVRMLGVDIIRLEVIIYSIQYDRIDICSCIVCFN